MSHTAPGAVWDISGPPSKNGSVITSHISAHSSEQDNKVAKYRCLVSLPSSSSVKAGRMRLYIYLLHAVEYKRSRKPKERAILYGSLIEAELLLEAGPCIRMLQLLQLQIFDAQLLQKNTPESFCHSTEQGFLLH